MQLLLSEPRRRDLPDQCQTQRQSRTRPRGSGQDRRESSAGSHRGLANTRKSDRMETCLRRMITAISECATSSPVRAVHGRASSPSQRAGGSRSRLATTIATLRSGSRPVSAGRGPSTQGGFGDGIDVGSLTSAVQAYCHLVVAGRREPYFDPSIFATAVPGLEFVEIAELGAVSDLSDVPGGTLPPACQARGSTFIQRATARAAPGRDSHTSYSSPLAWIPPADDG